MDSIKVADCMSRQYVSFSPSTPVVEAAMELLKNELLGGPVIDSAGKLVGWISEQDCISVVSQVMYYSDRVATVDDVMSRELSTVDPDRNAMDVAEDMKKMKRKLFPVVEGAKVVGVVSRRHILRAMLKQVTGK
ncbi:CBS domain-containing protein [Pseudomaricurvus sp. HS19]|uniref:CBS domain-containing protein n=1 Tax=Pseudomaricurvus sp. HS19 TaxID=2692626 RepID=UPI0013698B07|nr:CBS domain-containing protein [Pseudomaricurvus sp. HS19]MYM64543.1 CBS domain-containing protein [Pseudomaricurvus sp. HS19]